MKKLLTSVLILILLACPSVFASWDGLPWNTTQYKEWSDTKSINIYSQLVEGVQERCSVLGCHGVQPLQIEDTWRIQVGTTNGYAIYTNVVTTNIMVSGQMKIDISGFYSLPGYKPPQTNNPQELTLYFPLKHEWIDAIDDKLFEITPYFVQTNHMRESHGTNNFDAYFHGYSDPAYLTYPMHCRASVMSNANIGMVYGVQTQSRHTGFIITDGYAWFTRQPPKNNEKWTIWEAYSANKEGVMVSGSTSLDGYYAKVYRGDPFLSGWFPFDYSMRVLDPTIDYIYFREDRKALITKSTSRVDFTFPEVERKYLWGIDSLSYTLYPVPLVWSLAWRRHIGYDGYYLPEIVNAAPIGYADYYNYEWGDLPGTNQLFTTDLITGNNWRDIHIWGANPDIFPVVYSPGYVGGPVDDINNHPQLGISVVETNTIFWIDRPLVPYDRRYYEPDGYSFLTFNPSSLGAPVTNAVITVNLIGLGWSNNADYYVEGNNDQAVTNLQETVVINVPNTGSSTVIVPTVCKWYSVDSSSTVTGLTTVGSSVTLGWNNWHSFANVVATNNPQKYPYTKNNDFRNPYNLYIQNLEERAKYMSQLTMTVGYNDYWVHTSSNYYGSSEEGFVATNTLFDINEYLGDFNTHPNSFGADGGWYGAKNWWWCLDGLVNNRNVWGTEDVGYIPDPMLAFNISPTIQIPTVTNTDFNLLYDGPYVKRTYSKEWTRYQNYIWRTPAALDLTYINIDQYVLDPTPWIHEGVAYNAFYGIGFVEANPWFSYINGPNPFWWSFYTQFSDLHTIYPTWAYFLYDFFDELGDRHSGGYEYDVGTPHINNGTYGPWISGYENYGEGLPIEGNHTPNWMEYDFEVSTIDNMEISRARNEVVPCNTTIVHEVQFYAGAYGDLSAPDFSWVHKWDGYTNHVRESKCISKPWEFDMAEFNNIPTNNANSSSDILYIASNSWDTVTLYSKYSWWGMPYEAFCTNLFDRSSTVEVYVATTPVVITNFAFVAYSSAEFGRCRGQFYFLETEQLLLNWVDFNLEPDFTYKDISISTNTYYPTNMVPSFTQTFVATNACDYTNLPSYFDAIAHPEQHSTELVAGNIFLHHIVTNEVIYYLTNTVEVTTTNTYYPKVDHGYESRTAWYTNNGLYCDGEWIIEEESTTWVHVGLLDYPDAVDNLNDWYTSSQANPGGPDQAFLDALDDLTNSVTVLPFVSTNTVVQSFVHTNYVAYLIEIDPNTYNTKIGERYYHQEEQSHAFSIYYNRETVVEKIPPLFIWDFKRK